MIGKRVDRHKTIGRHKFKYLATPPIEFAHAILS
jgi:hypothetical protein